MWSLPDINRLNADAKSKAGKKAIQKKLNSKTNVCDYDDGTCNGEVHIQPYWDIFSPEIKGTIKVCDAHEDHYGQTPKGYFYCGACDRTMIENYTWELYYTMIDDEQLCLCCALDKVMADEENWITLDKATLDNLNNIINFEYIRIRQHVIGVGQDVSNKLQRIGCEEFDSMDGHCISGGGIEGLRSLLLEAKGLGAKKAIILCEAGYQFSVSMGVYCEPIKKVSKPRKQKRLTK